MSFKLFIFQFEALVRKHFQCLLKTPIFLLLSVFGPGLAIIAASLTYNSLYSSLLSSLLGTEDVSSLPQKLSIPSCSNGFYCSSIIYYSPDDPYHSEIMKNVASATGLRFATEVKGFADEESMIAQFYANNAKLQRQAKAWSVVFTSFKNQTTPKTFAEAAAILSTTNTTSYTILDGVTTGFSFRSFGSDIPNSYALPRAHTIALQVEIDSAITAVRKAMVTSPTSPNVPKSKFTAKVATFSAAGNDTAKSYYSMAGGDDAIESIARTSAALPTSVLMTAGFLPLILLVILLLANEKHGGLLSPLRKLAMLESAYWASVYTIILALTTVSATLSVILSRAVVNDFFMIRNTDTAVLFLIQWLYGQSLCAFASIFVAGSSVQYASMIFTALFMIANAIFPFVGNILGAVGGGLPTSDKLYAGWWFEVHRTNQSADLFGYGILPSYHYGRLVGEVLQATARNKTISFYNAVNLTLSHGPFNATQYRYEERVKLIWEFKVPPAADNLGYLFLLTFVCLMLCWYLNQVIVGKSGGARPFYFIVGWMVDKLIKKDLSDSMKSKRDESASRDCVVISGLEKKYGKTHALQGVDMIMRKGKVFVLLGHNGSGKTSLINILTGLLTPTSGDCFVFGHSASQSSHFIQNQLGSCPQHDLLWDRLTPYQHMRLFCRFKGIPFAELDKYICERLDRVGLLEHKHKPVGTFSGGMKRRLSIIACSIGSPKLIVLDEPTTETCVGTENINKALDPINRRKVWEFIKDMRKNAVLLLTTHNMEEADALGDDICIIDHGKVKATGTALELKNRHGTGYQVTLLTAAGQCPRMSKLVRNLLPDAKEVSITATSLTIALPKSAMSTLPAFFRFVQSKGAISHPKVPEITPDLDPTVVKEWGVQNCSLEQVFLKLCGDIVEKETADTAILALPDNEVDNISANAVTNFRARPTFHTQIVGVILKNWAELGKLPLNTSSLSDFIVGLGTGPDFYGPPSERTCDLKQYSAISKVLGNVCTAETPFFCPLRDYGIERQLSYLNDSIPQLWYQDNTSQIVQLSQNQTAEYFFKDFTSFGNISSLVTTVNFINKTSAQSINQIVYTTQQSYSSEVTNISAMCFPTNYYYQPFSYGIITNNTSQSEQRLHDSVGDIGIIVNHATSSGPISFDAEIRYFANQNKYSHLRFVSPKTPIGCIAFTAEPSFSDSSRFGQFSPSSGIPPPTNSSVYSTVKTAKGRLNRLFGMFMRQSVEPVMMRILGSLTNAMARQVVGTDEKIFSDIYSIPFLEFDEGNVVITLLLMISFYWFFPIFVMIPFMERVEHLFGYYRVNGLLLWTYWLGNYAFNMLISLPVLIAATIILKLSYAHIDGGLFLLICLVGVHSIIGWAFLFSTLIPSVTLARLLSFIMPIVIALPSAVAVHSEMFGGSGSVTMDSLAFSPLAFAFCFRVVFQNYDLDTCVIPLALMFVTGLLCIILAIFVSVLFEKSEAIKEMLAMRIRLLITSAKSTRVEVTKDVESPIDNNVGVMEERNKVAQAKEKGSTFEVYIKGLNKWFGSFRAVQDLHLGLEKGECFGLLGPNGAGKTTTIQILQGSLKPSSGIAMVGGYEVTNPMLSSVMGVCPQHDRVFLELTVEENLLFFARVRGASWKMSRELAEHASKMVGLTGPAYIRQAQFLSGGMRRRLALAIAMIGSPRVLFLDEPTTGLDPANRLHMWRIIGNIRDRKEHCICLISHSMDEVDTLSTRIGIMAAGSLRCIGSQITLKNKFGTGYSLVFQTALQSEATPAAIFGKEASVTKYLTSIVSEKISKSYKLEYAPSIEDVKDRLTTGAITVVDSNGKEAKWSASIKFGLPNDIKLGDVLEVLEACVTDETSNVVEWGLNQSTLEDVFIRVATKYVK
ncbi:hypothetical protein BKA69DRAFT_1042814 [Paraphysoderma sedebokerense]|nr:hypothetical protein BKA69DRAFT_1042814 [Paraphysoderma sedebokerense]